MKIFYLFIFFLFIINISFSIFNYNLENAIIFSETEIQSYDLEIINSIIKNQKQKVESFFDFILQKRPIIYFSSTLESFKQKTRLDWFYGGLYKDGIIYLQPFSILKKYENLENIISHEYTHFFIDNILTNLHYFVNEGLVLYLTGNFIENKPPLIFENMLIPDIFTNYDDLQYYLSSSVNFIKYCILKFNKYEFIKSLFNYSSNDIYKTYKEFYYLNCDKIRVWINPRNEKRFFIKFNGECDVISRKGTITNKFYDFISLEIWDNLIFLNNEKDFEFYLNFNDGFILIDEKNNKKEYRGNLKIYFTNNVLYIINILPLEEYLYSVVSSEMNSTNIEALKVQAVISRSVALYKKFINKNEIYDVISLTSDQSYKGKLSENYYSLESVKKTEREVIFYSNQLVYPYYSSTCAGHTAFSYDVWEKDLPYIKSVKCGYYNDILCKNSPHFTNWERKITINELSEIFGYKIYDLKIEKTNSFGRVKYVKLNNKIMLFDNFKSIICKIKGWAFLKSNIINIEKKDDETFLIKGIGFGHGVGVCQYGAISLANKIDYKSIIKFYFHNVEIKKAGYKYNIYPEF